MTPNEFMEKVQHLIHTEYPELEPDTRVGVPTPDGKILVTVNNTTHHVNSKTPAQSLWELRNALRKPHP